MELTCLEACLLFKAAFCLNAETVNKTNQYESAHETNFLILVADRLVPRRGASSARSLNSACRAQSRLQMPTAARALT